MKKNQKLFIVLAIILIVLLFLSTIFTIQKVPKTNWGENFQLESKEAYGGKLFFDLVKARYGADHVFRYGEDTLLQEVLDTGNLLLAYGNQLYFGDSDCEVFMDFLSCGNSIILISDSNFIDCDSIFKLPHLVKSGIEDSVLNFRFFDNDSLSGKHYTYRHYKGDFSTAKKGHFTYYEYDSLSIVKPVVGMSNQKYIGLRYDHHAGKIYYLSIPDLFANHGSQQDYYLNLFNGFFSDIDAKLVIFYHPDLEGFDYSNELIESPIQYILSAPALRLAYILLLLTCLIYLVFSSKRKQRIIPVIEKRENTSVSYVETLSNLFSMQKQNYKLVPHMEDVFYHRVKTQYYISRDDPEFVMKLSKKSKIEKIEIEKLIKMMDSGAGNRNLADDQLIKIYTKLNNFYKNSD